MTRACVRVTELASLPTLVHVVMVTLVINARNGLVSATNVRAMERVTHPISVGVTKGTTIKTVVGTLVITSVSITRTCVRQMELVSHLINVLVTMVTMDSTVNNIIVTASFTTKQQLYVRVTEHVQLPIVAPVITGTTDLTVSYSIVTVYHSIHQRYALPMEHV